MQSLEPLSFALFSAGTILVGTVVRGPRGHAVMLANGRRVLASPLPASPRTRVS